LVSFIEQVSLWLPFQPNGTLVPHNKDLFFLVHSILGVHMSMYCGSRSAARRYHRRSETWTRTRVRRWYREAGASASQTRSGFVSWCAPPTQGEVGIVPGRAAIPSGLYRREGTRYLASIPDRPRSCTRPATRPDWATAQFGWWRWGSERAVPGPRQSPCPSDHS
jgi:hypothetical protein